MKEDKEKNNKLNQHHVTAAGSMDTDMEWFNQFDEMPGIHDVYTRKELNALKNEMLDNVRMEINKMD